jgi:FkbM family methyltransferase
MWRRGATDGDQFMEKIMWERAITILAKKLVTPSSGIIDVGANIGGVSHAFSQIVPDGKVIAIEANRSLIRQIRFRKYRYHLTNLVILNRAAYKQNYRILKLWIDSSPYASSSSLYRIEQNHKKRLVPTITLDSLKVKNLSLIKIDVEGAEVDVLLGAKNTISNRSPWIIFEIEVPIRTTEKNPISMLDGYGYLFFDVNTLERISYESLNLNPGVFNLLAVPRTKVFDVQKQLIQNLDLGDEIDLKKGEYLFSVELGGDLGCKQGIGIWNLTESNWEIYYETRMSSLVHTTNSCLPVYLDQDSKVEIRFGLECPHAHFVTSKVYSLNFLISQDQ